MENIDFIPVLLGSDINVYGMARSFHEAYGVRSIAVSKTVYTATVDSKIIDFTFEPDLENPEKFLKKLFDVAETHHDKTLVLVPCSDGYVKLVVTFQDKLAPYYKFNCLSEKLLETLTLKDSFYRICAENGFDFPKTLTITKNNYLTEKMTIQFPVIVKASNSVDYWKCDFVGKRKVFLAKDRPEYDRIVKAIYGSTYKDALTVQEYVPGDDSCMRVLNCYVGLDKKVKLMALGQPLLEDHTPQGIGNYVAIISIVDNKLCEKFRVFLEKIGYSGFANFDMKLDSRDGKYKLFETNVRQGRSSSFVTASGYNLAKWLVDDVVYGKKMPLTIASKTGLWLQVPKGIVYKYVHNKELIARVRQLVHDKKCVNPLFYSKDFSPKRYAKLQLSMLNHFRRYKRYFGKKGLE